jgi:hypothetical protein
VLLLRVLLEQTCIVDIEVSSIGGKHNTAIFPNANEVTKKLQIHNVYSKLVLRVIKAMLNVLHKSFCKEII